MDTIGDAVCFEAVRLIVRRSAILPLMMGGCFHTYEPACCQVGGLFDQKAEVINLLGCSSYAA